MLMYSLPGQTAQEELTPEVIRKNTIEWVIGFNAIPQQIIIALDRYGYGNIHEVTPVTAGCYVYDNTHACYGSVRSVCGNSCRILPDGETEEIETDIADLEIQFENPYPIWGTFWQFGDAFDRKWIGYNLEIMTECGFRVFWEDDYGYIFGIDGAGYDFYDHHWIRLYKRRFRITDQEDI